ncbi:MAG: agmatine deiminase family protein [Bacteroidales bacterium]|nr:agmatine deiminase family protein [Bacteroidales bacterium]MDD3430674.1 agmatine deiminase family protein [Bacteroidales bacterium]MDD4361370.1 agmatine deiminase family protein [Bacteroidales bacterium]MDD4430480.1 agmatine deiminase family protein [Bacteroidales bacterium]
MKQKQIILPPEWAKQSFIQLTWPNQAGDWAENLEEVEACYTEIARQILRFEALLIVCGDKQAVRDQIAPQNEQKLFLYELPYNDTWTRDFGPVSVYIDGKVCLYDFGFNAWGEKFAFDLDNKLTARLWKSGAFGPDRCYYDRQSFILEGGSIESDGASSLLTTSECLLSPSRNPGMNKAEIELYLKQAFGLHRVLWIEHSYLQGDDTDGHIDMLARFCDKDTITYVSADFPQTAQGHEQKQLESLRAMEEELKFFRTVSGQPYRLIPLPLPDAVWHQAELLPASYANFLIINGAVLLPVYGQEKDQQALNQLTKAFPDREIIPVNCLALIKQHGSLHCISMQYPEGKKIGQC